MSEFVKTDGSRRIITNGEYVTIWDPRIKNYPGNHPMHQALGRNSADYGVEWVMVPKHLQETTEAILDQYPVEMQTDQQ